MHSPGDPSPNCNVGSGHPVNPVKPVHSPPNAADGSRRIGGAGGNRLACAAGKTTDYLNALPLAH